MTSVCKTFEKVHISYNISYFGILFSKTLCYMYAFIFNQFEILYKNTKYHDFP